MRFYCSEGLDLGNFRPDFAQAKKADSNENQANGGGPESHGLACGESFRGTAGIVYKSDGFVIIR
jgi:hypothetical protein